MTAPHGERRRYQAGCKCSACTDANTRYQRRYRSGMYPTLRYSVAGVDVQQLALPLDS